MARTTPSQRHVQRHLLFVVSCTARVWVGLLGPKFTLSELASRQSWSASAQTCQGRGTNGDPHGRLQAGFDSASGVSTEGCLRQTAARGSGSSRSSAAEIPSIEMAAKGICDQLSTKRCSRIFVRCPLQEFTQPSRSGRRGETWRPADLHHGLLVWASRTLKRNFLVRCSIRGNDSDQQLSISRPRQGHWRGFRRVGQYLAGAKRHRYQQAAKIAYHVP